MGVERVDYYSEDEYQSALIDEAQYWNEWERAHQEPDVVPCFRCGCQMYQECHAPEGNICPNCKSGERTMNKCCEGRATPYCPECASPVQGYPLIEIKVYFEGRLKGAENRLAARRKEGTPDFVGKAEAAVAKWTHWIGLIETAMVRWSGEQGEIVDEPPE